MLDSFTSYDHCCLFCSGFMKTKAISRRVCNVINRNPRIRVIQGPVNLYAMLPTKYSKLTSQTDKKTTSYIWSFFLCLILKALSNSFQIFHLNRHFRRRTIGSSCFLKGSIHHHSSWNNSSQLVRSCISCHFDEPSLECVGFCPLWECCDALKAICWTW